MPSMVGPDASAARTVNGEIVTIDHQLVQEAATWIRRTTADSIKRTLSEVGEYLLKTFFHDDITLAASKNPLKNASFRALADRCGTMDLPVSKTWLNNAFGVALMNRQLPRGSSAFALLPSSIQESLLPLKDPVKVEQLARQAVDKRLGFREVRQQVAEERAKSLAGSKPGATVSTLARGINRSLRLLVPQIDKLAAAKAELHRLDADEARAVSKLAEELLRAVSALADDLRRVATGDGREESAPAHAIAALDEHVPSPSASLC